MAGAPTGGRVEPVPPGPGAGLVERLTAIAATGSPQPWNASVVRDELARDDRLYVVACEGDEIVGFAGSALQAGEAHVMALAVEPAARRRGHGRRLVETLLVAAVERGVSAVTLEVRTGNDAARRLYRRLGFDAAGVRPGYYPDGEDAVIMWWRAPGRARPLPPPRAADQPHPGGG